MHFKAESGKVLVDESQASSHVLPGEKNESAIVNIQALEYLHCVGDGRVFVLHRQQVSSQSLI
jgi:hypothetical protein